MMPASLARRRVQPQSIAPPLLHPTMTLTRVEKIAARQPILTCHHAHRARTRLVVHGHARIIRQYDWYRDTADDATHKRVATGYDVNCHWTSEVNRQRRS